jgi:hypothetical protein
MIEHSPEAIGCCHSASACSYRPGGHQSHDFGAATPNLRLMSQRDGWSQRRTGTYKDRIPVQKNIMLIRREPT